MQIVTVELSDGQSAMAHSRPTHGQMKAIFKAYKKRSRDDDQEDVIEDVIMILCTSWVVKADDGSPIPFTKEGIGQAPNDIITELSDALTKFTDDGITPVAKRLATIADDLDDDDPMKAKILDIIPDDSGN